MEKYLNFLQTSYYVMPLMGVIYTYLEYKFPLKAEKKFFFKRNYYVQDIFWSILNEILLPLINRSLEFFAAAAIAIFYNRILPILVNYKFQSNFYFYFERYGIKKINTGSFFLQLICIFICRDFLFYIFHRFMHRSWLWKAHALHHSSTELDWLSVDRGHWFEYIISQFFMGISLLIFETSTAMIVCFTIFEIQFSLLSHSNVRLRLGFLKRWIQNPLTHHWHHAKECKFEGGQNFGNYTLIWDRLFGTYYIPEDESPPDQYGILNQKDYPEGIIKRLLYPFLKTHKST